MRWLLLVIVVAVVGCGSGTPIINGKDGAAGTTVSRVVTCTNSKTINSQAFYFEYQRTVFSNGEAYAFCSVSNNITEASSSSFYLAGTSGADDFSCIVRFDVDTATSGYWSFTYTGSTPAAEYVDPGSAFHGTSNPMYSNCSG